MGQGQPPSSRSRGAGQQPDPGESSITRSVAAAPADHPGRLAPPAWSEASLQLAPLSRLVRGRSRPLSAGCWRVVEARGDMTAEGPARVGGDPTPHPFQAIAFTVFMVFRVQIFRNQIHSG